MKTAVWKTLFLLTALATIHRRTNRKRARVKVNLRNELCPLIVGGDKTSMLNLTAFIIVVLNLKPQWYGTTSSVCCSL